MYSSYPKYLLRLIEVLKKLPGVGARSAERYAFSLLEKPEKEVFEIIQVMSEFLEKKKICFDCGCLSEEAGCRFCPPLRTNTEKLCIVVSPKDALAIENTHAYKGLYHVIGAVLSPMLGKKPEDLKLSNLKERVAQYGVKEVIIALDSTVEGDATAMHIGEFLKEESVQITRLAFGLPMGSALEFVDGGTLTQALQGRSCF